MDSRAYFYYWGKAFPQSSGPNYHPLVYHCLDVAAVGRALLRLPAYSLKAFADELGWPLPLVERLMVFFLVAHDTGKFARAFQGQVSGLAPELVQPIESKHYHVRHDTLGWLLWRDAVSQRDDTLLPAQGHTFWNDWMKVTAGHHGKPPQESTSGGNASFDVDLYFDHSDIAAAESFLEEIAAWLLPAGIPEPSRRQREVLNRYGWRLAGLSVLADWLGSNQNQFPYRNSPMSLSDYWERHALPQAEKAVYEAGLGNHPVRSLASPLQLFDYLRTPTPLQELALQMPLKGGPQLFLLEDVTGAGKTEAALILAYRLMEAGAAHGLYFGLPTMATANQMYQRMGQVYSRFYGADANPSLVLAHGARQLVEEFRQSILGDPADRGDCDYHPDDKSATSQCSAWLADHRKKALLADVGVGTLDQALLGILPVRHQSLRLLGLSGKVLIADEVHAFDPYMCELLAHLLEAHARQGGSAILLSATLPAAMRTRFIQAFQRGAGSNDNHGAPENAPYPLLTHACAVGSRDYSCETRKEVRRTVEIRWEQDEEGVRKLIKEQAAQGRCVCWIRNTVGDARRAYETLREECGASRVTLFHSRYAMGDRLAIEADVLARFGKQSREDQRAGHVLIATQVVEQSLDLDFDVLITDLAPIDLLIQRAGRLHRHVRDERGNPSSIERRATPVLHIHAPRPDLVSTAHWYADKFPAASHVYPDIGKLWLTQQILLRSGCIVSPGTEGEPGAVRVLVEAVYGDDAQEIPDALMSATQKQLGAAMAERSQARFNALDLEKGYCYGSSRHWYEDTQVPTRLSEQSVQVYLARWDGERLVPWVDAPVFAWEHSSVQINASYLSGLSAEWEERFKAGLQDLRSRNRLLEEPALIVPLVVGDDDIAVGEVIDAKGRQSQLRYDCVVGLSFVQKGDF